MRSCMKKYLIVSDLDGSLADESHQVNEETKQFVRGILDQGHLFYISTGRMKSLVANVAKDIDPRVGIIGSNGGIIQKDNETLKTPLGRPEIENIFEVSRKHDIPAMFFTDKDILYTDFIPDFFSEPNEFHSNNIIKKITHFHEDIKELEIINALIMGHHLEDPYDLLHQTKLALVENENLTITSSNPLNLEVYSRKASKGNALKHILEHHKINPQNTIVFGDGHNDVSMFEVANISVAMDNAPLEVKSKAKYVTKTNGENGVIHFLSEYFK